MIKILKETIILFVLSIISLNCDKTNIEISDDIDYSLLFKKNDFINSIPVDYEVDWGNSNTFYSELFETEIKEFPIQLTSKLNKNLKKHPQS